MDIRASPSLSHSQCNHFLAVECNMNIAPSHSEDIMKVRTFVPTFKRKAIEKENVFLKLSFVLRVTVRAGLLNITHPIGNVRTEIVCTR